MMRLLLPLLLSLLLVGRNYSGGVRSP